MFCTLTQGFFFVGCCLWWLHFVVFIRTVCNALAKKEMICVRAIQFLDKVCVELRLQNCPFKDVMCSVSAIQSHPWQPQKLLMQIF